MFTQQTRHHPTLTSSLKRVARSAEVSMPYCTAFLRRTSVGNASTALLGLTVLLLMVEAASRRGLWGGGVTVFSPPRPMVLARVCGLCCVLCRVYEERGVSDTEALSGHEEEGIHVLHAMGNTSLLGARDP